jgi:hypothetical protein
LRFVFHCYINLVSFRALEFCAISARFGDPSLPHLGAHLGAIVGSISHFWILFYILLKPVLAQFSKSIVAPYWIPHWHQFLIGPGIKIDLIRSQISLNQAEFRPD